VSLQIIVAIAWAYIAVLMAMAEATSARGSIVGALMTFMLYGVLPLAIVLYILGAKGRRRSQLAQECLEATVDEKSVQPDTAGHPPGDAVTAVGKEM
jgi:Flp pilus assembly protein TadB